jgi:hypothetical protein
MEMHGHTSAFPKLDVLYRDNSAISPLEYLQSESESVAAWLGRRLQLSGQSHCRLCFKSASQS